MQFFHQWLSTKNQESEMQLKSTRQQLEQAQEEIKQRKHGSETHFDANALTLLTLLSFDQSRFPNRIRTINQTTSKTTSGKQVCVGGI
jgi:hypothetical protein